MIGEVFFDNVLYPYSVEDDRLMVFSRDQSALIRIALSATINELVGHRYDGYFDLFYNCTAVRSSFGREGRLEIKYLSKAISNVPDPKIVSISISSMAFVNFFDYRVLHWIEGDFRNQTYKLNLPGMSLLPVSIHGTQCQIGSGVSIAHDIDPQKSITSTPILLLKTETPISVSHCITMLQSIRLFFVFLFNTRSVCFTASCSNDDHSVSTDIKLLGQANDEVFKDYHPDKCAVYIPNWVDILEKHIAEDYPCEHVPLHNGAQDNLARQLLVAATFEGLAKKAGGNASSKTKPSFKMLLDKAISEQTFWIEKHCEKIGMPVDVFIEKIIDNCKNIRNRFAHGDYYRYKNAEERTSMLYLEKILYCFTLRLIGVSNEGSLKLLERVFNFYV